MNLEREIKNLKKSDRESYKILNQIYSFYFSMGTLKVPKSFERKISEYFGNRNEQGEITETIQQTIHRIQSQRIVKTFNKWTGEGALFNSLRTNRPGMSNQNIEKENDELGRLIKDSQRNCDFCKPEKYTPGDVFGRVMGKHSTTASNIAKYDAWSGLVIFQKHNPLDFNFKELSDYLNTAYNWFLGVYGEDKSYRYPFFVWNCLYKAGASIVHGHAQILVTQEIPYAKIESFRLVLEKYKRTMKSDYLKDMFHAHHSLGLGFNVGNSDIIATLTPIKEKEIIIISAESPFESIETKKVIYNSLRCFIDILGVKSFNFSISGPSLDDEYESPYIIRFVDRGSLFKPTADMGGMELFGSSVVGDDPYKIIQQLKINCKDRS